MAIDPTLFEAGGAGETDALPKLNGPYRGPLAGGAPRQLVVLLHGLGADGNDLIALADHWAQAVPQAAFISPDAPFPCDMAPFGRQWFSLKDPTLDSLDAGVRAAAPILNGFLDEALAAHSLTDRDLALVGFSQGTMTGLHVALRRSAACAGVLGYSGALMSPWSLAQEIAAKPPVLLVHGDADPIVPARNLADAETALREQGVSVRTVLQPGLAHSIDQHGVMLGARFLAEIFGQG